MTADEARLLSDKNSKIEITHTLNDVYTLIKEACENGLLDINFVGNISESDSKKLVDDGFEVSYFRYNGLHFTISWQII